MTEDPLAEICENSEIFWKIQEFLDFLKPSLLTIRLYDVIQLKYSIASKIKTKNFHGMVLVPLNFIFQVILIGSKMKIG